MFKKITFHALFCGAIFIVGVYISDISGNRFIGKLIALVSLAYFSIGVIVMIRMSAKLVYPLLKKVNRDIANKKYRKELLAYKELLDKGILNQDEFDSKASELKKKILY